MNNTDYIRTKTLVDKYGFIIDENKVVYNNIENISISIGDKIEQCIYFTILNDINNNKYKAKLVNLKSFMSCSIFNNLEKGKGTLDLLCVLKEYLDIKYPYVKEFSLEDYSQIECIINKNKLKKISLSNYYFVLYRKTWYEDKLNAIPLDIDIETYNNVKDKFNDKSQFLSYEIFEKQYLKNTQESIKYRLKNIYNNVSDYSEFFDIIRKKGNIERCDLLYSWLDDFIYNFCKIRLTGNWNVYVDKILCINKIKNIITLKKGGNICKNKKKLKNKTRKNKSKIIITQNPQYFIPDFH